MPKNYRPAGSCKTNECGILDHYLTANTNIAIWCDRNGAIFAGYRDERYRLMGGDKLVSRGCGSSKELHELLEDDNFVLNILLTLESV